MSGPVDLDEVRQRFADYRDHQMNAMARGWSCCSAHGLADRVPALLAEVERLRAELGRLRAQRSPVLHRWQKRRAATGGGPCPTCGKPFWTHVCLSCSPDSQTPGPGCLNCRNTGMDQTPCLPPASTGGAR